MTIVGGFYLTSVTKYLEIDSFEIFLESIK